MTINLMGVDPKNSLEASTIYNIIMSKTKGKAETKMAGQEKQKKEAKRSLGWLLRKTKPTQDYIEKKQVQVLEKLSSGNNVNSREIGRVAVEGGRRSVSHVEANLESVRSFLQVKVLVTDMPAFMQAHAFRCARRTYDGSDNFSSKHTAFNIKKEFDKMYGPAWHCIVGSSFGSFVTHSTGCFLYFSLDKLFVLVFKTKIQKALE